MKKIISIFVCLLLAICFCSCAKQNDSVFVSIEVKDGVKLAESFLNLEKDTSTAQLITTFLQYKNIDIQISDGMIVSIDNTENSDSEGWLFYINGELAQVGVNDYIPQKDDKLEIKYLSYSVAFPEFYS